MNLEELINLLDDMVLNGWSLPMSGGKCIVDREKIKDIIQDMRLNMPNEIRQAKSIVADRNEILANARMESQAITEKAQERAARMVDQEEIIKLANQKANTIVQSANDQAKEIRQTTREYSEKMLESMEEMLTKSLLEVKQTRQQIKNALK